MNKCVIVRGGGDIATGTIYKLVKSGFQVLVLEVEKPSAIRRNVAFCQAVYEQKFTVEDMTCVLVSTIEEAKKIMAKNQVAMMIDPSGEMISKIEHIALVDAILAKKNLGTTIDMAPITIGLGPGFCAGKDVHVVVETMRGHNLGRLIYQGCRLRYGRCPYTLLYRRKTGGNPHYVRLPHHRKLLYYGEKHESRRNFDFQRGCCYHVFKFHHSDDIFVHFTKSAIDLVT